jgi:hypothetical protein
MVTSTCVIGCFAGTDECHQAKVSESDTVTVDAVDGALVLR